MTSLAFSAFPYYKYSSCSTLPKQVSWRWFRKPSDGSLMWMSMKNTIKPSCGGSWSLESSGVVIDEESVLSVKEWLTWQLGAQQRLLVLKILDKASANIPSVENSSSLCIKTRVLHMYVGALFCGMRLCRCASTPSPLGGCKVCCRILWPPLPALRAVSRNNTSAQHWCTLASL